MLKRVIFVALVFIFTLFSGLALAESTTYDIAKKYRIYSDGRAEVEVTYTATNQSTNEIPETITIPLAGDDARNISIVDQDDNQLTNTVTEDGKAIQVTNVSDSSSGSKNWQLKANYEVNLGEDFGASKVFIVQPLSYGDLPVAKETIQIDVDVDLGVGVTRGLKPSSSSQSLGEQTVQWVSDDGPIQQSVGLVFGERAVANFNLDTTLKNDSWWWKTVELTLPPDTNQQQIVLTSIEPKPSALTLDVDGNIIAKYNLRPKQSKQITATGEIYNNNYTYALTGTSTAAAIPQSLVDQYTANNEQWPADQVEWSASDNPAVTTVIEEVFNAVVAQIPDDASGYDSALQYTNTYIGELRSSGIPARLVLGRSYLSVDDNNNPEPYAWAEAYVPGTGWISVDVMAGKMGEAIGHSDVSRIGLVVRGVDPNYPPEALDSYSFSWQSEADIQDPQPAQPTVTATNNIILPGFAIHSVDVDMGSGTIVDGAAITIDGGNPIKLGSLAPLQTSTTNSLAVGGSAFAATNVAYGILDGDTIGDPIADAMTSNNYLPMIGIIVVLLIGIGLIVFYKKRYSSKKEKNKKTKANLVFASEEDGAAIEDVNLIPVEDIPGAVSEDSPAASQAIEPKEPVVAEAPKPPEPEPMPEPEKPVQNRPKPRPQSDTIGGAANQGVKIGGAGSNPYKKSKNLIQ